MERADVQLLKKFLIEENLWDDYVETMIVNLQSQEILKWAEGLDQRVATPVQIFANGLILEKSLQHLTQQVEKLQQTAKQLQASVKEDINWH